MAPEMNTHAVENLSQKNAENTRKKRTEKTQNHVSQPVGTNTNTPVPAVVKFGLDITRIPLRTDGRWKAYL